MLGGGFWQPLGEFHEESTWAPRVPGNKLLDALLSLPFSAAAAELVPQITQCIVALALSVHLGRGASGARLATSCASPGGVPTSVRRCHALCMHPVYAAEPIVVRPL